MYTQKLGIIVDHCQEPQLLLITVDFAWKVILPKQNNQVTHLDHLCFIRLIGQHRNLISCYNGWLLDTIVFDGSQFTRRNL